MKEITLQGKVAAIVRNLMKTGEFKDYIEITSGLMYLTFVSQRYPDVFEVVLNTKRLNTLKAVPKAKFWSPSVDYTIIKSEEALELLIEAFSELIPLTHDETILFAESLLDFTTAISGKQFSMFVPTKPEVAKLMAFIAAEMGMDSVFDPFTGVPTYAVAPEFEDIAFNGYEISSDASALGNLLLALNGKEMTIKTADFLKEADKTGFSEGLISIPPFNMSIRDMVDSPTSARFVDEFLIERFLEDGDSMKAIFILPMRFAFSDGSEWLRQELLDREAIDMVISLPQGLLNGTQIPSLMLVLNREKIEEREGKITFMSLLDCIVPNGKNSVTLDLEKAKQKVSSRSGKYVTTVDIETVNDYIIDLNPGKFLTNDCARAACHDAHLVSLSALLYASKKDLARVKLGETMGVVGLNDLSSQYNFVALSETPESKTTTRYFKVSKDAVIIGATSDSFKVGRFKYKGQPLLVSDRLIACQLEFPKERDYILLELTRPYVSEQIKLLNLNMINVDIDYLLRYIYIVRETKEHQDSIVKEAKDAYLTDLHEDVSLIKDDFRRDVHMKRHAMGQTIASIGSWWTLLEKVRSNGNAINESIVLDGLNITVGEVLNNIRMCFGRLSVQIDKFDRGYKAKPEVLDLNEFCASYIKSHQSPIFKYDYSEVGSSQNDSMNFPIFFPKEVLALILNNIISNACSHGFNNERKPDNIVKVAIVEISGGYQLTVSNNGIPCAADMTPDKMVMYGESTDLKRHCGIGAYEIKQLMNDFGGRLEILLDSNSDFPVEYRLTFNAVEYGNN